MVAGIRCKNRVVRAPLPRACARGQEGVNGGSPQQPYRGHRSAGGPWPVSSGRAAVPQPEGRPIGMVVDILKPGATHQLAEPPRVPVLPPQVAIGSGGADSERVAQPAWRDFVHGRRGEVTRLLSSSRGTRRAASPDAAFLNESLSRSVATPLTARTRHAHVAGIGPARC